MWKRLTEAVTGIAAAIGAVACGSSPELSEIPEGAIVVDVRTAGEFEGEHFPDAINIPVQELGKRTEELGDRNKPIVVYCRSGHRSAAAKALLEKAGFTNVLDGGPLSSMMRLAP